jgi:hypothetical protein
MQIACIELEKGLNGSRIQQRLPAAGFRLPLQAQLFTSGEVGSV